MHEYDVALKNILTRPGSSVLAQLTGASSLKWLNVEAPKVSNQRVDLLGELPDGNLVHIELQSRNEKDFPLRMAEYLFGIRRRYGRLPRQVALYVGEVLLRMNDRIEGPDASVRFHLVDIRDLDGERLLASANVGDNILRYLRGWVSNRKSSAGYWNGSPPGGPAKGTRLWPSCLFLPDCGKWKLKPDGRQRRCPF
jgi:hypothetical protein